MIVQDWDLRCALLLSARKHVWKSIQPIEPQGLGFEGLLVICHIQSVIPLLLLCELGSNRVATSVRIKLINNVSGGMELIE